MKKINSLRYMEPGSGEFYKIKNWVDTFMRIPFGKNEGLPISIDDGVEKCHEFMENAQKTLLSTVENAIIVERVRQLVHVKLLLFAFTSEPIQVQ